MAKGKTREGMAHAVKLHAGQSCRLVMAALVALASAAAQATTWYVSPSGDGTDPTAGFATGFPTIKAALANASLADDDVVLLDRATFDLSYENRASEISSQVSITKRIVMTGVGTREETVLDGGAETDGRTHNPSFSLNADGIIFKNMTFERLGNTGGPGAAITLPANVHNSVVSNMIFRNTGHGYTTWKSQLGGIIYNGNDTSGMIISGCVFTNNVTAAPLVYMKGYATSSAPIYIENCCFANNRCVGRSGWDYALLHIGYGKAGGAYVMGDFRNNTVVGNYTKNGAVGQERSAGWNQIFNSIVYGNRSLDGTEIKNCTVKSAATWFNNCIEAGSGTFGDNNVFADPRLDDDNIHLTDISPCIGAGTSSGAPAVDIDGTPRGAPPCIGCSEFVSSVSFTCAITNSLVGVTYVCVPETITLGVSIDGTPVLPLSYAWDFDGDGVVDSTAAEPVLSMPGEYNVSVVVSDANGAQAAALLADPLCVYPAEKVFYVVSGDNPNAKSPYLTWETAATSIGNAYVHASRLSNTKIVLGDGIHSVSTTLLLTNAMTVTSLNGRDRTVVLRASGDAYSTVTINDPDSVLENVALASGGYNLNVSGAAANIFAGTMRNVIVTNFNTKGSYGTILMQGGSSRPARMERCIVANNSNSPGRTSVGVFMRGYSTMENCLVTNNVSLYTAIASYQAGVGLNCNSDNAVIRNCTFAGNQGDNSNPVFFSNEPAVFENNIVTGGTTNGTGGVVAANDCTVGFNATLIRNLNNCCLYPAALDYSGKTVVLTCAPGFVGPGDCHLSVQSPCVNAGVIADYTEASLDLDGKPRIYRRKVDIGCYENQQALGLMMILQ